METQDPLENAVSFLVLANKFMHVHNDSAIAYCEMAVDLCAGEHADSLLFIALSTLAKAEVLDGHTERALENMQRAGVVARRFHSDVFLGQFYNLTGRYHRYLEQYDSALYYTLAYDDWLHRRGSESQRYLPHLDLSNLYFNLGDKSAANDYMMRAVEFARIQKIPKDYGYVLVEAIAQFELQGDLNTASTLTEEYLAFKYAQNSDPRDILEIPQHSHFTVPGKSSAELKSKLLKYIPIHAASKNWLSLSQSCYTLGNIYLGESAPVLALPVFQQGLSAAEHLDIPGLTLNMHSGLYRAYAQYGDPKLALEHHKRLFELKESIRDSEKQALLADFQVKYETRQKELELGLKQRALSSTRLRLQILGFGAIAFLLLLAVALYAYNSRRKSNNRLIEKSATISRMLEEKTILLREIHHRVKNNLQMISALLYLHGKSVEDVSAQEALLESQNRVQSMAIIHQNLYQGDNLLGVEVQSYLDKLLSHLTSAYHIDKNRVAIRSAVEVERIDVDTIIPIALIMNELISNALKYAFEDGRYGEIFIGVKHATNGISVQVKDNGIGLPTGFARSETAGFGYELIRILCERLGAQMTTEPGEGTSVSLIIPSRMAA